MSVQSHLTGNLHQGMSTVQETWLGALSGGLMWPTWLPLAKYPLVFLGGFQCPVMPVLFSMSALPCDNWQASCFIVKGGECLVILCTTGEIDVGMRWICDQGGMVHECLLLRNKTALSALQREGAGLVFSCAGRLQKVPVPPVGRPAYNDA